MIKIAALSLVSIAFSANATFQLRGENMVYDTTTDLTWVRSASFSQGSIYDDGSSATDGRLTYNAALSWVSQLKVPDTETSTLIGGWRLPSVNDLGDPGCDPAYTAGPNIGIDCGYVGSGPGASELGHLINGSLSNPTRIVPTNFGPLSGIPAGFAWLGLNYTPSVNDVAGRSILTVEGYFVREPSAIWPPTLVWGFALSESFQAPAMPNSEGYAWAVRTGDVSLVPEPSVTVLLALGIAVLSFGKRIKRSKREA